MEKELLRLILNYGFWKENKDKILPAFFPSNLKNIFNVVTQAHIDHPDKDITIGELKALYKVSYPNTTTTQWEVLEESLHELPSEISNEIAKEVLQKAWVIEMARQISIASIDIINQRTGTNFETIKSLLSKVEEGVLCDQPDDLEAVSSDLEQILAGIKVTTKWKFYLPAMKEVAQGIGPGIFTVIAARVETGKTACLVSILSAPGGLADQGARCAYFCNEEPAIRTQGRAVMCYTGMNLKELALKPDIGKRAYEKIRNNIKFYDIRDRGLDYIEKFIARNSFDAVVFDMLDKLHIEGTYNREDERLGAVYGHIRSIGVRTGCTTIGSSQLNAEAEGKTYVSTANFANARTAKGAEADLAFGIGKDPGHEECRRVINVIKNKITGDHRDIICNLNAEISRYTG